VSSQSTFSNDSPERLTMSTARSFSGIAATLRTTAAYLRVGSPPAGVIGRGGVSGHAAACDADNVAIRRLVMRAGSFDIVAILRWVRRATAAGDLFVAPVSKI